MLIQLISLYIFFFTILCSYLLFVYPRLFKYSDILIYFTVFLNIVSSIYLTFIESILSQLLAFSSIVLLPSLYIYHKYGSGDHMLPLLLFSPYLLILGIFTWRPTTLTTLQTMSLFISSTGYLILLTIVILHAYRLVSIGKRVATVVLMILYAILIGSGLTSFVKFGIDGLYSQLYIPISLIILFALLIYAYKNEFYLLKYLSLALIIIEISTFIALDYSGSNGPLYFYERYNTLITYYALIPIAFISRVFLKHVSLSTELSIFSKKRISLLLIYGVALFVWFRSVMAGLTPYRYVQLQVGYLNDFINYFIPILLFLSLIHLLDNFTSALGLAILYLSLNHLLAIYGLNLYSIGASLIIILLIASLLKGFRDSHPLFLAIILIIIIFGVYSVNYDQKSWDFYLNLYTSENQASLAGLKGYAILKNITYNELTSVIESKFKIFFTLDELNVSLEELTIYKRIYSIDVSIGELYLLKGPDIIIIDILPDSSLMGSMDYFVSTSMLTNIDEATLLSGIFGVLICNVYVLENALYYILGNFIIFISPIFYSIVIDKFRKH